MSSYKRPAQTQPWPTWRVVYGMRWPISATVALCIALTPSSAAAHRTPTAPHGCALPSHTRMLAADPQAQVYEKLETATQEKGIYGCVYGSRHTYFLGEPASGGTTEGFEGISRVTLAGSVVAYEYASGGPGPGGPGSGTGGAEWVIVVRDLRNDRILNRVPTGTSVSSRDVGSGPAMAIVVKGDGAVAWIAENDNLSTRETNYNEVHALDKSGNRVLASGFDIERFSLGIVGSTVYWTQGGKPESAALN